MLDLGQLDALRAVADHGRFTAAARQLGLSQPGLSRRIQRLEEALGTVLVDRGGKHARLTPAGERVLAFATETRAAYDELVADLRRPAPLAGMLRLVASTTPGEYVVPGLVAEFTTAHPGVRVRVLEADSGDVPTHLFDQGWDVGFVGHAVDHPDLVHVAVADDEIVLAVPASHRLAREGTVDLDDLAGEPLLRRQGPSGTQATVRDVLSAHGLQLPTRPTMSLGSTQAVVAAVADGLGVGFVSTRALERQSRKRVRAVRLRGLALTRRLHAVYERERTRAPHVQTFLAFLRERRVSSLRRGART